ncbi:MAG: chromosomal replication initiator protein DnaA [Planctomycetota bacterium]|jgi:chromosomal replication initiator protein
MATISDRTWDEILTAFRDRHPELSRPWFNTLTPVDFQHGVIRVNVGEPNQHQYLANQCQTALSQVAQAITGRLVTINFMPPPAAPDTELPLSFEAESEYLALNSDFTFDNFVTGPCNRLAHAACVAVAENPGRVYNPLFVHGDVGLGKTHLLHAVCHQISASREDAKILYMSCETFTNHFVEAIERGALHRFRYRYRHVDALVIDDIQFLAARERSREEFFHTFNTLFQAQKQIVLSADESPQGIPSLEDRLVSRFNWGLVARIDSPCLETRMAIVNKKARLRCAELPEEVVHYIAATITANTREIEGALLRILALSQQYSGMLNLDIAREAIGQEGPAQKANVTIPDIIQTVMDRYGVRLADLQGKRRNRSLALPRQICMYLARQLTSLSLEEIGGFFGGRDHTTVLHAIRTISEQRKHDGEMDTAINQMTILLRKQWPKPA